MCISAYFNYFIHSLKNLALKERVFWTFTSIAVNLPNTRWCNKVYPRCYSSYSKEGMNYGRILIPTRERIKRFKVCGNSSLLLFIAYELCACITFVYVLELTARRVGISLIRKISLQLAKQWSPQTGIFSSKDKRCTYFIMKISKCDRENACLFERIT